MEKMIPFLMCAIFVLISFGFWIIAVKLSSFAARKRILAQKNTASKEATSVLLISYFGESAVRTNACLPLYTEKNFLYVKIDNIVILPTCIAVVQTETMSGQIFNNDARTWHQSLRMPNGERKEKDFENPIINNERNVIALSSVFEKAKIQPPPIRNIVIFSSDKVIFSEEKSEVYSLSAAIEKMKALSKGKRIPLKDRIKYAILIRKKSVSVSKARQHNAKVLRAAKLAATGETGKAKLSLTAENKVNTAERKMPTAENRMPKAKTKKRNAFVRAIAKLLSGKGKKPPAQSATQKKPTSQKTASQKATTVSVKKPQQKPTAQKKPPVKK